MHATAVSVVEIMLTPSSRPSTCTPVIATLPILLPNFLPCLPNFSQVTCHRHFPYLTPYATSTRYRAISHRHDLPSATLPSGLYIQLPYVLYLVRFELVDHTPLCTSHTPSTLRAILHYCASVPWCCDSQPLPHSGTVTMRARAVSHYTATSPSLHSMQARAQGWLECKQCECYRQVTGRSGDITATSPAQSVTA